LGGRAHVPLYPVSGMHAALIWGAGAGRLEPVHAIGFGMPATNRVFVPRVDPEIASMARPSEL